MTAKLRWGLLAAALTVAFWFAGPIGPANQPGAFDSESAQPGSSERSPSERSRSEPTPSQPGQSEPAPAAPGQPERSRSEPAPAAPDQSERGRSEPTPSELAERISQGHAYSKHVVTLGEFRELGIRSRDDFRRHIEGVVRSASAADRRSLQRRRRAYYGESSRTVVIYDPGSVDLGTAFRPRRGRAYFENLE